MVARPLFWCWLLVFLSSLVSSMALRHRKLFPALTAVNQTVDCQGFCEAACPYNCSPYPDYYFWPSPPPPQPLSTQNHNVVPYVIVVVIILAVIFLAVSYYLIAGGSQFGWFGSRNNRQQQPQSQTENRDEEFVDEIRPVAHPIWFIARMGLHQSTINSITIIKYRKDEGLIEGTVCSVCLNEFQQGETLRLLPKCSHAFHISCIDAWLRSHTNCPLCRARIVDEVVVGASVISVNRNPDNSNAIVNSRMENPEINIELGNNAQERNEACEGRGGAEEEREMEQVGDERILKGKVDSDRNGDLQPPCDPGDNHKKDGGVHNALTFVKSKNNHKLTKNDMQQIRSLSMDHLTCPFESQGRLVRPVENTEQIGSAVVLKQAKRQCLHTIPFQ